MKKIITMMYESNDRKLFKTEKECRKYENSLENNKRAKEALITIREICNKCAHCSECPFEVPKGGCVFQIDYLGHPYEFLDYFKGL